MFDHFKKQNNEKFEMIKLYGMTVLALVCASSISVDTEARGRGAVRQRNAQKKDQELSGACNCGCGGKGRRRVGQQPIKVGQQPTMPNASSGVVEYKPTLA